MSARRQPFNPLISGGVALVIIVLVVGLMAKINLDFGAPWSATHTLTMQVADAEGMGVSSDVRIAGRVVGQVTGVQARGAHAELTLHIDGGEWPLSRDSTASIRLGTLLGQKYVEIQPGRSSERFVDDDVITVARTQPLVDLDQLLDTLDKPTRDSLTSLVRTAAGAVAGQEGTVQQLIPDLRQLSTDSTPALRALAMDDPHLDGILVDLGIAADQLARSRDDLVGVVDNLESITGTLAANQGSLRGAIRNTDTLSVLADSVLGSGGAEGLNAGLRRLNGLAHRADSLLAALIPQSQSFRERTLPPAIDLLYRAGDATSQSDAKGYFLRLNFQGLDLIGLTPNFATAGNAAAGNASPPPAAFPPPPSQSPLPLPPGLKGLLDPGHNGSIFPVLPPILGRGGLLRSYPADPWTVWFASLLDV